MYLLKNVFTWLKNCEKYNYKFTMHVLKITAYYHGTIIDL